MKARDVLIKMHARFLLLMKQNQSFVAIFFYFVKGYKYIYPRLKIIS